MLIRKYKYDGPWHISAPGSLCGERIDIDRIVCTERLVPGDTVCSDCLYELSLINEAVESEVNNDEA